MAMHAFRSRHRPPGPALAPPGAPIPLLDQRSPGRALQPTTFRWLAVLATIFAYAQISLGAAVRVSGSGLGCGNDWPLCHGHIVPPLNTQAIVEYAHRTVGSLTGVLLIVTVAVGWLTFRRSRPFVIGLVTAAAGLIVLEGLLGALVVFKDLAGVLVLAHLAVALALIGLLIAAAILAVPGSGTSTDPPFRQLTLVAMALTYALLLTGAGVVATGADKVCTSWPLCGGGLRLDLGGIALYATLHRLVAGLVGLFLLYTLGTALFRWRSVRHLSAAASVTLVLLLIQIGIGYPTATGHNLSLVDGLHVAVATAVWCGVVAIAVFAHGPGMSSA
jgi:heme a synthase